jgi:hypothetical protein
MDSKAWATALLMAVFLLSTSLPLTSVAQTTSSSSLTFTVNPDGSVIAALSLAESSMQQPGTQPNASLQARASTSGGRTTIKIDGTMSLPAATLNQEPYNYSNSVSVSGSYSNNISRGSIIVQAVPGISSPLTTFKLNYHGNSSSITLSGNVTLEYGTYGSGSSRVVLNASSINYYLTMLQQKGINASSLNKELANLPYGPFSVTVLTLSAVPGANTAMVSGYLQMSGNMTALPVLLVSGYVFGLFGTFTTTSQVAATSVTCIPQAPASCTVTLQNSGNAAASVTGCILTINGTGGMTSSTGEVSPVSPIVPAGSSVEVTCTAPAGVSGVPNYGVYGMFTLSNGAEVSFSGMWDPPMSPYELSTATTTNASNSTQLPHSVAVAYSAYYTIFSSFQDYSYTVAYSGGVLGLSVTVHATQNLNLEKAMKLLAGLKPSDGVSVSLSKFLNSTRVDISGFTASLNEVQQANGEVNTQFSAGGLTIYPGVVMSGNKFNESALFNALGGGQGNVTLVGGSSSAGSVSIEVPPSVPPPASHNASRGTYGWISTNMSDVAGVQFAVVQQVTTTLSSSTTMASSSSTSIATSSSSSTSSQLSGTSSMTLVYAVGASVVVVIVAAAAYFLRRSPKATP